MWTAGERRSAGPVLAGGSAEGPGVLAPAGPVLLPEQPAEPLVLAYPAGALVVVAGLPGAGKSTLLRRVGPASGAAVHDPELLRARLPRVPYPLLRPFVHLWHRHRVRRALGEPGSLLVHEPAFRAGGRRWLLRAAARAGRPVHLLVVAASPAQARAGQRARNRRVTRRRFAAHVRGARELGLDRSDPGAWATGPLAAAGVVSTTVLPRAAAGSAVLRVPAPVSPPASGTADPWPAGPAAPGSPAAPAPPPARAPDRSRRP